MAAKGIHRAKCRKCGTVHSEVVPIVTCRVVIVMRARCFPPAFAPPRAGVCPCERATTRRGEKRHPSTPGTARLNKVAQACFLQAQGIDYADRGSLVIVVPRRPRRHRFPQHGLRNSVLALYRIRLFRALLARREQIAVGKDLLERWMSSGVAVATMSTVLRKISAGTGSIPFVQLRTCCGFTPRRSASNRSSPTIALA